MTIFDSESTIFFEQLLFYSAFEQNKFLDDVLLQDTKILFTLNADMTRQTSIACHNILLINILTLMQQCSQRTLNEPETIDSRETESLQFIIEQRTSFKAIESRNSPLIIDDDDIAQSSAFPKSAEIPDSQACKQHLHR
jgi:hypothetical protein